MGDPSARHQIEHAVEKTDAGAQGSGRNTSFLPEMVGCIVLASGVSTSISFHRQVAGHLVGEQHPDLVE